MLGIPIEDRARLEVSIPALVRILEPAQRVGETKVEQAAQVPCSEDMSAALLPLVAVAHVMI